MSLQLLFVLAWWILVCVQIMFATLLSVLISLYLDANYYS